MPAPPRVRRRRLRRQLPLVATAALTILVATPSASAENPAVLAPEVTAVAVSPGDPISAGAPAATPGGGETRGAMTERTSPRHPVPPRPDILFVTFDTTRRDHLSCYGHERLTTPSIDRLAATGVLFTDCQAVIPVTGPSHASLMTGLYPHVHGAFRNGVPLPDVPATLAETLAAQGYRTGAFVAGWTLKAQQSGLDRGFEAYDDEDMDERYSVVNLMRRAQDVTDATLRWTDEVLKEEASAPDTPEGERAPLFLFVHYFDPHEPYEAPGQGAVPENPNADGGPRLTKHDEFLDAYDREIRYADDELGRLIEGLRERGVLTRTSDGTGEGVVVFTADHGQSFGEHGYGGKEGAHGRHAYQSTLAAPFVVSAPGRARSGQSSDAPVSHLDVMPTILELAGVPPGRQPLGMQGMSLVPLLEDPSAPSPWAPAKRVRYGFAFRGAVGNKWNIFRWLQNKDIDHATPLEMCAITDSRKILFRPDKRHRYEVYDLAEDPGELRPLDDPDGRHRKDVAAAWTFFETTRVDLEDVEMTDEQLEALSSLGYVD